MIRLIFSIAIFANVVSVSVTASIPASQTLKIGGGRPVDVKNFANQALLLIGWDGSCGGVIFDETTIITAAHWLLLIKY